ncbi:hypothetical protein F0344_12170 [Streptomyces finlayi]|uniref:Uncharacterized protein n=1 Tax=Streptomyces finlayi TaxID=67296 RepID=A0A7G7BIV0_9ACTN|nr:hypothetical protein [Streptomyces finlayi]QNE75265.1 hypothetical protein F0344_12170 [Streptomyces finlayi]
MDDLGYTPTTLGVEDARKKTVVVSSQIFDMIGIKEAETTKPGAGVSPCEEDPEHLFSSRHPWSLYGVSDERLTEGFARLKENLPKYGWKIVEYGPNNSPAKTLELTADSEKEHYSVNAELRVATDPAQNHPSATRKSSIQVRVVSGCFRAPEGTDLNGIY